MKNHSIILFFVCCLSAMTAQGQSTGDNNQKTESGDVGSMAIIPPPGGGGSLWNRDADGDGYGDPNVTMTSSSQPMGYVANALDCDDTNAAKNPDTIWYRDADGDGFGDNGDTRKQCSQPSGYILASGDCNDGDATVNPNKVWYRDVDGDGFGTSTPTTTSCTQPTGYVSNTDDQCATIAGTLNGCPVGAVNLSEDQNYVFTRVYKQPTSTEISNPTTEQVLDDIVYFDGLGRPMQQILIRQAANTKEDLVTHIEYDNNARKAKEFQSLPRTVTSPGKFQTGVKTSQQQYYQAAYSDDFTTSTINAFSETRFELSPINRPLEQGAPGTSWAITSPNSDHTIKYGYKMNSANEVRLYRVNLSSTFVPNLIQSTSSFYSAQQLNKNITKNENWTSGLNNTTEEFTDKQGRLILKRTYANTDLNNDGDTIDANEQQVPHDTYYVYDDFGNLTYVIPPKVITSDGISAAELSELCYQYRYDHRNRLIEKKIPGKGAQTNWESIVYNKLDQPIMTQDPNLKALDQWLFTKYDPFGRVAYIGLVTRNTTRAILQAEADNNTSQFEQRSTSRTLGGTTIYYTNNAYPGTSHPASVISEIHIENYYDTYLSPSSAQAGISVPGTNSVGEDITPNTTGLPTVKKIRILGTSNWITTVTAYEQKGRSVWVKSVNPINPAYPITELVESDIDFLGNIIRTKTTHSKTGQSSIVTTDNFTYDHANRLTQHTQTIGTKTELISHNTYSKTGELVTKKVGNTFASPLQTVTQKFNVRGWLKQINDPSNMGTDLFSFKLNYNTTEMSLSGVKALYNGNISESIWRTANNQDSYSQRKRGYGYQYDDQDRILAAHFRRGNSTGSLFNEQTTHYNVSGITYDKNGNIGRLNRRGVVSTSNGFGDMDKLNYIYSTNSNKLLAVQELTGGIGNYGFINGSTAATEYIYDTNGNLTSDLNKGITSVLYNHLNMPTEIKFNGSNTQKINYTYSADGIKLRKATNNGGTISTTDYAGNFIYENNTLKQFFQEEGYVEPKGSGWQYVYQYKDIWGNTRITYADDNSSGSVTSAEIRREQNYYPFGLEHKGYNFASYGAKNNLKTYQGQEFTEDLGLNTHEWKYRMSDPSIGRFWQIDPLAEDYTFNSTYAFQENKLGKGIELEGKELDPFMPVRSTLKAIQLAKDVNTYLKTGGGGFHFTSKNGGNGDPGRQGGRDTQTVDADGLIQAGGYAKTGSIVGPKQKAESYDEVVMNFINITGNTVDGMKIGEEIVDKSKDVIEATAKFPTGEVKKGEGNFRIYNVKDSTATFKTQQEVENFKKQAKLEMDKLQKNTNEHEE